MAKTETIFTPEFTLLPSIRNEWCETQQSWTKYCETDMSVPIPPSFNPKDVLK